MSESTRSSTIVKVLVATAVVTAVAAGTWWCVINQSMWPRSEALQTALTTITDNPPSDRSLVATVILDNFLETRRSAAMWSGVYWGCTFLAAVLSVLATMTLKLETLIRNEGVKKDLAATFSIIAALLITISTSGDFQRKWQANRIAAAQLESVGYEFLEANGEHARSYLVTVGNILLNRNISIVGGPKPTKTEFLPKSAESQGSER